MPVWFWPLFPGFSERLLFGLFSLGPITRFSILRVAARIVPELEYFPTLMGSPSTKTSSFSVTFCPTWGCFPFTVTRPISMNLSASRREHRPESLINLFNLISSISLLSFIQLQKLNSHQYPSPVQPDCLYGQPATCLRS